MVEKVSKVIINLAMKVDSTPDDNALLKHIAKKKKLDEGGVNMSLVAILTPSALVRLATPLAQAGGLQKTVKQAAKEVAATSYDLAADSQQTKKGDSLRRQVALAVACQMATMNTGKNSVNVPKGVVASTLNKRAAETAFRYEGQSTTPLPANVATNTLVDVTSKLRQSSTAQHLQAVNSPVPQAEAGRQKKQLRTKEDYGEGKPIWQGAKQAESVVPKQGESAAQSRNIPLTLQQLKAQASWAGGMKGGNEGQTVEVHYHFQRWSGEHSVRISMPTEARREGNVTLLPSDARAADALLRNIDLLTCISPDLLRPQQGRDEEQQQRRQQQQQLQDEDEDQE